MEISRDIVVVFIFLLSNIFLSRSQGPTDGCSLRIRKPYNAIAYENTNPECTSGKIWWNYPSGKLVVNFQYEMGHKPFLLCMILKQDASGIKFYDITEGSQKSREMPFSKEDLVIHRLYCTTFRNYRLRNLLPKHTTETIIDRRHGTQWGYYTCVPDLNGKVSLLMSGPFYPITYLYMLQYRLLIDWEPTARLSKA